MVFIFIFATASLLIWAAIKPWVGKWIDVSLLYGICRGLGLKLTFWIYRVREKEGAIYRCRIRVIPEPELIERCYIRGRRAYSAYSVGVVALVADFGSN